jgi:hypothetical protein
MTSVYNFALVAYPLYQTSNHFSSNEPTEEESRRLLNFWVTFGGFKVLESFGADHIPFFYIAETLVLVSLYSKEHSVIVSSFLPRIGKMYNNTVDKAYNAWTESATVKNTVTSVTTNSFYQSSLANINTVWSYARSYLPGGGVAVESENKKKE